MRPSGRSASWIASRRNSFTMWSSNPALACVPPTSAVIASASRSSTMRSARSNTWRLAYGLSSAHPRCARSAARYAWSISSTVATVIEASFSPLYGSKSTMSHEPLPTRHSPSMY